MAKLLLPIKGKSPLRNETERIKQAGAQFQEMQIVTGANSTNGVMQTEVIMCALNISVSHEESDFSLVDDPKKEESIYAEEDLDMDEKSKPELVDATDKFPGVDPTLGDLQVAGDNQFKNKASSFYELDDEMSDQYRDDNKTKNSAEIRESQIKLALGRYLSGATSKGRIKKGGAVPSIAEKYRGRPGRKRVNGL